MVMFTGHAEQVALVVMQHLAIRPRPQQAVAVAAIGGLDDHTAGNHGLILCRLGLEPTMGGAVFRLGEGF